MLKIAVTFFISFLHECNTVCQFQNPFYFIDRPSVVTVVDSSGQMVADRLDNGFSTLSCNIFKHFFVIG